MDELPTGFESNVSSALPVRWEPHRGRLLKSAIPMTLLAAVCALLALYGIPLAWLGVILLMLGSYRSWLAVLMPSSALELTDTGISYRHGLQTAMISWQSLVRCGVVNLSHGARGADSVRIVWRSCDGERVLDVDPAYSNPDVIAQTIAAHSRERSAPTGDDVPASDARSVEHRTDAGDVDRSGSSTMHVARRVWFTPMLLGLIIAVTGWEFWRWGMDPTVAELARSGGISTGALMRDEWYSIGMANLLHANLLHVGMNCVIILLLGLVLERAFGGLLVLACAALASITTTMGALVVDNAPVTIGASGIGFALMGCAFAVDPRARSGVGVLARQLLPINLLITLLASSIISVGGHLGGLVAGLVVGRLLVRGLQPPRMSAAAGAVVVSSAALAGLCTLSMWAPDVSWWVQRVPGSTLVERQLADRITENGGEVERRACAISSEGSSGSGGPLEGSGSPAIVWRCEVELRAGADGGPGGSFTAILRFDSPSDQFDVEQLVR